MTFTFPEQLRIDGTSYQLRQYPLEDYLALLPARPNLPKRPWNTNGYMATWSVEGGNLYLVELSAPVEGLVTQLFPHAQGPVRADWSNGILAGCRGNRRHVGYPPRLIFDDGISVCSEMMRVASCSDDISSEKKPTTPPLAALKEPSACCAGT